MRHEIWFSTLHLRKTLDRRGGIPELFETKNLEGKNPSRGLGWQDRRCNADRQCSSGNPDGIEGAGVKRHIGNGVDLGIQMNQSPFVRVSGEAVAEDQHQGS